MFWKEGNQVRKSESSRAETAKNRNEYIVKRGATWVKWTEHLDELVNISVYRKAGICVVPGMKVTAMTKENRIRFLLRKCQVLKKTKAGKAMV